ncbi:ABC-2 type transporter-domain-containing protein [Phakopsora pachyrhizi]|nr:ABC-2 type transporter-domain-containing protein [Phakopsora pachyrhizi]
MVDSTNSTSTESDSTLQLSSRKLHSSSLNTPTKDPSENLCQQFLINRSCALQDLGSKSQGLPIRFRHLSVNSHQLDHVLIDSLPIAIYKTFKSPLDGLITTTKRLYDCLCQTKEEAKRSDGTGKIPILKNFNGLVNQSEMVLILGRPKSGVTSILRAISLNHECFSEVTGQLDFGNLSMDAIITTGLRPQIVMIEEADDHFPSLQVLDTLNLAARCKTPKTRPGRMSRAEWVQSEVKSWSSIFNISESTLRTAVGSEKLRGISGGERRRVSVIEGLLTRSSVLCLDNVTAGLDSFSSYQLIKSLKVWCKVDQTSAAVGLRQVSDVIYQLFDKVSVVHSGHQIYFGPASDAVEYFKELGFLQTPNQPIADFLCSVTDPSTRKIQLETSKSVPMRPSEFVAAFERSKQFIALKREMLEYDSKYPVMGLAKDVINSCSTEKDIFIGRNSCWTVNYFRQVLYLTLRQYALIRADLRPYATKTLINILLSIIYGTLFYQLPATTDSAFTRGAIIFISILFNGYLQLSELGNTIAGRPIVKKHGSFGFYSPGALAIARTLSDIPLIAVQVILFATITYLLTGLRREVDRFLIYLLTVYATAINLTAIFRMFAALSPSFDEAVRWCGIILNVFVVYGGYFIPTPSMNPWLRWIRYYIDPVAFAFEAAISNEFKGLKFQCSPDHIVPRGPTYNDTNYQTCAAPGSRPKSLAVLGEDYLSYSYGYDSLHIWSSLVVIVALSVVFLVLSVLFTELFSFARLGSVRPFKSTQQVRQKLKVMKRRRCGDQEYLEIGLDDDLQRATVVDSQSDEESHPGDPLLGPRRAESDQGVINGHESSQFEAAVVTFSKLHLTVKIADETRLLLKELTGYFQPGECTALMGASGAGKTTLLNALAGRVNYAELSGEILIDGRSPTSESYRAIGYVEQIDSHDPFSTVREALTFSALLRQPKSVPRWAKLADVDRVIDLLGLQNLEDAIVGTTTDGLGLEDRKRLSIGVELVAKPRMLCLDEPISGMDSRSATHIIQLLKRLVISTNLTVVVTVHQPSREIFESFDKLILLKTGGEMAYFGQRENAVQFFESRYSILRNPSEDPAEYLINCLTKIDQSSNVAVERVPKILDWNQTSDHAKVVKEIQILNSEAFKINCFDSDYQRVETIYQEVIQLTKRLSKNFWRDSSFSCTQIFTAILVSMIIGLSFFQQNSPTTLKSLQNQMFSVFLILFIPPVFMNQMIVKWFNVKAVFEAREKSAGVYREISLAIAFLVAEMPYCTVSGLIYWIIWFFGVGFKKELETLCLTLFAVQLFFLFQTTWALFIATLAPTVGMVANILPFFLVSMEAFSGSLMPYPQMPWFWKWMYWLSPFQWYVKSVLSTVLHGQEVECQPLEIVYFEAPPSETCESYIGEFLKTSPGYLVKNEEKSPGKISEECGYCKFSSGDEFLRSIGFGFDQRYMSILVFGIYTILNLCLVFVFINKEEKREGRGRIFQKLKGIVLK